MSKPTSRSRNRVSRYQRSVERRQAQKRADQWFYNTIFGVIGACVLLVLGLAMIASSGNAPQIGGATTETLVRSTFLGFTTVEWIGLVIVAIMALFIWRRLTKR